MQAPYLVYLVTLGEHLVLAVVAAVIVDLCKHGWNKRRKDQSDSENQ